MVRDHLLNPVRIKSLNAVADLGSFTAASCALGYSVSAISLHVSTLERESGVRLVDKTADGYALTAAGVELCAFGAWMLDEQEQFLARFAKARA